MERSTGIALAVAGGLGLLLVGRRRRGNASTPDMRLSPHFMLSEFLRSEAVPEVASYQPTPQELARLQILCNAVLEQIRSAYGRPIVITSGLRPESVRNAQGQSFEEALRARGYNPAEDSDHEVGNGCDFIMRGAPLSDYVSAFNALSRDPDVRQVILYLRTVNGQTLPQHMHVAAVVPGYGRLPERNAAFVLVDGKRADLHNA